MWGNLRNEYNREIFPAFLRHDLSPRVNQNSARRADKHCFFGVQAAGISPIGKERLKL